MEQNYSGVNCGSIYTGIRWFEPSAHTGFIPSCQTWSGQNYCFFLEKKNWRMALLLFIYLVVCYFCAKFGTLRLIYTLLVWGFCMGWKLGWSKGLVIAILYKILCFSVWLQCAYNSAKSKNRFQLWDKWDNYWRHGDSLLFSLACAQVTKFHTYNTQEHKKDVVTPHVLPLIYTI